MNIDAAGILKAEFEAKGHEFWPTAKISKVDANISRITDGISTCDIDWKNQILHAVEIAESRVMADATLSQFYEDCAGYFDCCYNDE